MYILFMYVCRYAYMYIIFVLSMSVYMIFAHLNQFSEAFFGINKSNTSQLISIVLHFSYTHTHIHTWCHVMIYICYYTTFFAYCLLTYSIYSLFTLFSCLYCVFFLLCFLRIGYGSTLCRLLKLTLFRC